MNNVDGKADITNIPFKDEKYDFIFACHVLEYVKNDLTAISEIRRVLKPTAGAILPVPIVSITPIEYPAPNRFGTNHVRAPGFDYYDYFKKLKKYYSSNFLNKY